MTNALPNLRLVIVGCGGFANNYLPTYRRLEGVKVVSCVDIDPTAAERMAGLLGAAAASSDFRDAVDVPADGAVVSTPNDMHCEQALALLESGKHVLLQKPMARTVDEARRLYDYQQRSGQKLGLYMSMLDFGMWWNLRAALRATHPLGDVVQVSMRLGHTGGLQWNSQAAPLWRFSRKRTGGGALIMLGVHYVHFLRWLLGVRVRRVIAQTANLHCSRVEGEDVCQLQGELDNGGFVQLSVSWNSQGEHLAIYGTRGSLLYLDNETLRVHASHEWATPDFAYTTPGKWQSFGGMTPPRLDDATNLHNQHRCFWKSIRNDRPLAVEAIDGVRDLQVTDAAYRSAGTGCWEEVSYI